jgi:alpha-beta hydrolase superfamily lysophospholipase
MDTTQNKTHAESSWKTPDGAQLYCQEWLPGGEVKAAVVLVHGLGEHSSRYQHVADFLNSAGYAVTAFDLRGHGRSTGVRGDCSYDQTADDIQHFLDQASARFADLPLFLYGHSLGGALVLYYGLTHNPKLTGIIATSPGLIPAQDPGAKRTIAKIMARLLPSMTMNNDLDVTGLSHIPAVSEKYLADPLVHPKISIRLGNDLLSKGEWMLQQTSFPVPLLLLQGSEDRLVNPAGARRFAENVKGATTFHLYPGLYHELHNEAEQREVLQTILDWMENIENTTRMG